MKERLIDKIKRKKAKIAVMGLGYVGLPTATILAKSGFQVVGIDINESIVNGVSQGISHTREPDLDKLILKITKQGKLNATDNAIQALSEADIIITCVQTPINKDGRPNLTYLTKACESIAKVLRKGNLIIIQSTIPPKTMENLVVPILEAQSGLKCGEDFWSAYCPERMTPGNGLKDLVTHARIIGGYDPESIELAAELFRFVTKGELLLTDIESAEVAKLAENTFRYVNIAFANELALICKELGIDGTEVIRLANTHPRVNIHKPGCGVGGPCLRKDTYLLAAPNEKRHYRPELILASVRLNDYMPEHTAQLAVDALRKVSKSVRNSKIAVLGTAYKGEVNDARDSPSEGIICKLLSLGAEVVTYDPCCNECFGAIRANDIEELVKNADCLIIATDHKVFGELNLQRIKMLMKEKPIIIDGRRIINPEEAKKQDFIYFAIDFKY